jgi:hypothetical protein
MRTLRSGVVRSMVAAVGVSVVMCTYALAAPPAPTVTCADGTTTVNFKGNPTNVQIGWADEERLSLGATHEVDPEGGVHEVSAATPEGAAHVTAFVSYRNGRRNATVEAECTTTTP